MTEGTGIAAGASLRELQRAAESILREAGVETPELDARLLIQHALGLRREDLLLQARARLVQPQIDRVMALVERRARREPVSRIVGRREFWSLDFRLDPSTLDPRPDTETVVETVLDLVPDRSAGLRILDLGTGSGCILLALLSELPNASGLGVDVQEAAIAAARANAERLGLAGRAGFRAGNWGEGLEEAFDVVVSNPPYIPDADIAALEPEVREYDPRLALAGGADGLDAYRAIAEQLPQRLGPGGIVALEVGEGQADAVATLLRRAGIDVRGIRHDLSGVARCVYGARQL